VDALGSNEDLVVGLVAVGVAELNANKRSTTARVVDD
jgi:hypothetical protein